VSDDDPVAVRMVGNSAGTQPASSVSVRLFNNLNDMTNDEVSVTVFAAVGVTTVVSLVAFVAVYVYLEAVVSQSQYETLSVTSIRPRPKLFGNACVVSRLMV
jgi:hypothetical protein